MRENCKIEGCLNPRTGRGVTCGPEHAYALRYKKTGTGAKLVTPAASLTPQEEHRLRRENTKLKGEIRDILAERDRNATLEDFLTRAIQMEAPEAPEWVYRRKPGTREATPTAFLSDTHFGENVFPAQIEHLNGYGREIGQARLERFFRNTVALCREYLAGLTFPGIVLPLGGDLFSGDIHEELAKTNAGTIQEEILYWLTPMVSGIKMLADEFGKVFIPSVVGNHPRGTKKPSMKMRVPNNFDWLFVELLARLLADDKRVTFANSASADVDFSIYSTRYRLSHGDQFRGGSGIAGLLSPLMIGDARKRKRAMKTRREYDWLLLAHWHQRIIFRQIMVNGSLKGYDEYCYTSNFDFEAPEQSFWLTDPSHGVTITAPIHVLGKDEPWMRDSKQIVAFE